MENHSSTAHTLNCQLKRIESLENYLNKYAHIERLGEKCEQDQNWKHGPSLTKMSGRTVTGGRGKKVYILGVEVEENM